MNVFEDEDYKPPWKAYFRKGTKVWDIVPDRESEYP